MVVQLVLFIVVQISLDMVQQIKQNSFTDCSVQNIIMDVYLLQNEAGYRPIKQ